jgi:DNA-binding NarL/FixJ family response regulator
MNGGGATRIVLADEAALFREAMRTLLDRESDLEVVGEARNGLRALAEIERTRPHIALWQVGIPGCSAVEATRVITRRSPFCRVAVIADEPDPQNLVDTLEAGAFGYLTKGSQFAELLQAIRAMRRGDIHVPIDMAPGLITALLKRRSQYQGAVRRVSSLTRRERQVLALLADGADNDVMASMLVISPETVRTHVQNLLGKLGLHSRLEAAAFVSQHRLLDDIGLVNA